MFNHTIFTLLVLSAPPTSDRTAEPVELSAPEPTPAPAPTPTPAPPTDAVESWHPAPVEAKPYANPTPPPPPPPAKPARPDRPIRWRVDVFGGFGGEIVRDTAWRAFDYNRHTINLNLGARADFRLASGRLFLGAGAAWRTSNSRGDFFRDSVLTTTTRVREPLAFLRLSVVTVEGLDIIVQAGGGPSIIDLGFEHYYSGTIAQQRSVAALVDGMAGVALYLPKRWLPRRGASRLTAGIELAAGYTFRSKVDVQPTYSTDEDPISTSTANFGDVAIRGFAWRLGFFIRLQ